MSKWIEGTVVGQTRWTDRLYSLKVDADIGPFEAGQFAKLALAVNNEMVARPYSFVNAPKERPYEFYYVVVPEGPLSSRLARLEPLDPVFLAPAASGYPSRRSRAGAPSGNAIASRSRIDSAVRSRQ